MYEVDAREDEARVPLVVVVVIIVIALIIDDAFVALLSSLVQMISTNIRESEVWGIDREWKKGEILEEQHKSDNHILC